MSKLTIYNKETIQSKNKITEQLKRLKSGLIAEQTDRNTSINGLQSQITGVTNDIAILENTLSLKEKVANKSNEIDDSTQLYPSNKAVQTELKVRDANIQQLATNLQNTADLIPYITQSKGNSTEDVMSQDAVTKGFNYIESLMSE